MGAFLMSVVWWNLWMYHGFTGCPGIIARLTHADGEGTYDAMQFEMFLACLTVLFAVVSIFSNRKRFHNR